MSHAGRGPFGTGAAMTRSTDWASLRAELLDDSADALLPPDVPLPVLPEPLLRFNRRSGDPNVRLPELAAILDRDASLVCELLRTVNASAVGLRSKAASTTQALSLLGIRRVRLMLLSSVVERQAAAMKSLPVYARLFARANLERATFARVVAESIGTDADLAFAAGLMQDFLLPVLIDELGPVYEGLLAALAAAESDGSSADIVAMERAALGWDHAEAAARIMHGWGFPDDLVCCVRLHHDPERVAEDGRLARSPAAAAALASLLPDPVPQSPGGVDRLTALAAGRFELDPFDLAARTDAALAKQIHGRPHAPLAARLRAAEVA